MAKKDNKKLGCPTKYKEEYDSQAYKLTLLGYTDIDLASFFCVSEATVYNWYHMFPSFLESVKKGKDLADADVAKSMHRRAKGYEYEEEIVKTDDVGGITQKIVTKKHMPSDTAAAKNWLSNRQRKRWSNNPQEEIDTNNHKGDVIINIGKAESIQLPTSEDDIQDFTVSE